MGMLLCFVGILLLVLGVLILSRSSDPSTNSAENSVWGFILFLVGVFCLLLWSMIDVIGVFDDRVKESDQVESSVVGGYGSLDTYDEYEKFSNVYVAYRSYDDGKFSESEIDRLSGVAFEYRLKDAIDTGELSDSEAKAYEVEVNRMIDGLDTSEGKLEFKSFVLYMEKEDLLSVLLDGSIDERERELIEFAGDVLGRDVTNVIEDLERFGDSVVGSLKSFEDLIKGLDDEFGYFDVEDIKYAYDRENQLFKIDK